MLLQHREVATAPRQSTSRGLFAKRSLWSGVVLRRTLAMALLGCAITTTTTLDGAAAATRLKARRVLAQTSANGGSTKSQVAIGTGVQILNTAVLAGTGSEREAGIRALATLQLDWEHLYPGWTIAFLPSRPNLLGMTLVTERRVEIYIRADRPTAGTAHDIAHELGHVTDVTFFDDALRAKFLTLRRLAPATNWWTCNACRDLQVPAGDFAESFALLAAPRFRFYSEAAPEPTAADLDALTQLLPKPIRSGLGSGRVVVPSATAELTATLTPPAPAE